MNSGPFESRIDEDIREAFGEFMHQGASVSESTETATEQFDQKVAEMGVELFRRDLSMSEIDDLRDQLERVQSDLKNRLAELEAGSIASKERLRTKVNVALGHLTDLLGRAESQISAMYADPGDGS